jgi:hypothetical protein
MCERALWLDRGELKLDATVDEVLAAYGQPSAPGATSNQEPTSTQPGA